MEAEDGDLIYNDSGYSPGACTMMVAEQTQGYRISFELTKPNQSNLALLVTWSWSSTFSVNSGLILS